VIVDIIFLLTFAWVFVSIMATNNEKNITIAAVAPAAASYVCV